MGYRKNFSNIIFLLLCVSFLTFSPGKAFSQNFPTKPINLWVGFEAGGGTDLSARPLAEGVTKELGVPVVVEGRPGAGSTVAASLIVSKKPDGYTLAVISSAAITSRPMLIPVNYDPFKDFTFILAYAYYPGAICVRNDTPFNTLTDLLDYAKKNPGKLSYGSTGAGGAGHTSVELLAKECNVKFKHVPFKGAIPAITAAIGGHVNFVTGQGAHLQYVKQGVLRMLSLTNTDERNPNFPNVPTLKDLGYRDIPPGRILLVAPKGLPTPIFKKLEAAFSKTAHSANFRKVLDAFEIPFGFKSGKQLDAALVDDHESYSKALRELGMTKE